MSKTTLVQIYQLLDWYFLLVFADFAKNFGCDLVLVFICWENLEISWLLSKYFDKIFKYIIVRHFLIIKFNTNWILGCNSSLHALFCFWNFILRSLFDSEQTGIHEFDCPRIQSCKLGAEEWLPQEMGDLTCDSEKCDRIFRIDIFQYIAVTISRFSWLNLPLIPVNFLVSYRSNGRKPYLILFNLLLIFFGLFLDLSRFPI